MFIETDIQSIDDANVDLSGGDSHLREIADEIGVDYQTTHTDRTISTINGIEVEVFYDECGSVYKPWVAFVMGYGSRMGESREDAIESLMNDINNN